MDSLQLREPVSALSHGLGMVLALAATCALMARLRTNRDGELVYRRGKFVTLLIFGACLTFCYGASGLFHGLPIPPGSHNVFHRLDHVGIYLLIAGSYTPVAWSMMRGAWRSGTLAAVWTFAAACAGRVWLGGLLPIWMSTLIYMSMGWAALGCYRELMRRHSQQVLYPLPLGGLFYSVGAIINLSGRPTLIPGVFAAHELFHFLVLAGSACHFQFMLEVVVPAVEPEAARDLGVSVASNRSRRDARTTSRVPSFIPVPKFLGLGRSRERLSRGRS